MIMDKSKMPEWCQKDVRLYCSIQLSWRELREVNFSDFVFEEYLVMERMAFGLR
jgi:hypothetical protein